MARQSDNRAPPVESVPQLTPVAVGNTAVGVVLAAVVAGGAEAVVGVVWVSIQPEIGWQAGSREPAGRTQMVQPLVTV